jgi:anti-sigma regulatory factor (Ser/Thr protein kinase)
MTANENLIESLGPNAATIIEVRFKPLWEYIEAIRHLGQSFCQTTFGQTAVSERAQLIIQEALENAVKYSQQGSRSDLEILISSEGNTIEITVGSRPTPEDLASLREELEWICAKDAETAYLEAFKRAAENPEGSARLGLARMRFEGGVELSMIETGDGRIRLTARGAI